jgi:hypothetical protein
MGHCNGYYSFGILPLGCKYYGESGDMIDAAHNKFIEYLHEQRNLDFVDVRFGGDMEGVSYIANSGPNATQPITRIKDGDCEYEMGYMSGEWAKEKPKEY